MKIHLIGIGGIGVSALAQYYLSKGHQVSGSDLAASEITDFLKRPRNGCPGAKIFIGNLSKNIKKDIDLVVYSPAVKPDNREYKRAKELGIKTQSYPEALGELTNKYYTIAVSGAHGKSTTTAMIALVLVKAGFDPTVIVGTKVKEFGDSNFRAGTSNFLIIEACEYDSSFLHYLPKLIVVTNVDKEHLDYFKTFKNVIKTFKDFILKLSAGDFLVFNKDDRHIPIINSPRFEARGYSIKQKETAKLRKILKIPGMHNVSNALAALEVARTLEIPDKVSFSALSGFRGTWRRFQVKEGSANNKKITVVSDYGHHPNEISATLKAAREKYPKNPSTGSGYKIWCIFQPHQHQRTYYLFNNFVKVFSRLAGSRSAGRIDNIILTDIYDVAGRETKKINTRVSSKKLAGKINRNNVIYLPLREVESFVKKNIQPGDVLVIMGAGDIYKLADKF